VAQVTYHGRSWRDAPETAAEMFDVFAIMRQLHEILWYLTEAADRTPAADITGALDEVENLTNADAKTLAATDVDTVRDRIRPLLSRTSEQVRHGIRGAKDRRGADLVGAKLRGTHLRGANLRGAYLIGADLRDANLRDSDLLGADLRNTDLRGADLTGVLFLTQFQINAARGDTRTKIPERLLRPSHW
jgi:uncharacterized protein YjbI with pentapeptide repeats